MAYNGGYDGGPGPGGGRPYGGGGPGPGPGQQRPPPQRQPLPQQYDQYQDGHGYGYDDYGNGYDQGYGGGQQQFDDMNYQGRGGPPNDYPPQNYYEPGPNGPNGPMRGGRGGRGPMMNGRGGPMRPPPDGGRGGAYPPRGGGYPQGPPGPSRGGYPQGRGGRPGPPERGPGSDPSSNRRPPMNGPSSPIDQGFGGSGPFPSFPGAQRRGGALEEDQISMQMEHMELSGPRPGPRGPGPNGPAPQRGPMRPPGNGYGGPGPMGPPRGPPQPYPPQDYPDQRRGPPPGQGYAPQGGYPDEGFGPPGRSMTMPGRDPMGAPMALPGPLGALQRRDSAPQNAPMGRGVPPRPSTAQTMRPPPQRNYPPNNGPPIPEGYPDQGYGGQPGNGYGGQPAPVYEGQPRPTSFDDFYDYYDDSSNANNSNGNYPPPNAPSNAPSFDAGPRPRNSYDQQMQPGAQGYEQAQRGPGRVAEMNRAKSQPDLRNSQEAIFEMAGDIPPMPTNTQFNPQNGQGGMSQNFQGGVPERSQSFQRQTPPGQLPPGPGLPSGPGQYRPGVQSALPVNHNPDSLPSHPVPVRPGLMPGSIVNLADKPPPVRNYSGNYGAPQQVAPPPTQSAPPPMQPLGPPQPAKPVEPPVTAEELERLRAAIRHDPNDQASALRLAKKLVEASEALVPNLPDPKARARSREKYLVDAHKILRKLEKGQNPDAMFFLADCLGRGMFGSEPDHAHAFTLYQSAAKLGHAAAAYRTAVCCEIGNDEGGGTRKDPTKAIQWYKRAATLGDTPAMYKVGMILLKGLLGQQRNPREAISWLKRAAERSDAENPHALHELGLLYESADKDPDGPIIKDEGYALQLFTQAAELGYKFSQFRLGAAYEYGLMGCPINPQLSIMWYSKAAMQEEHQSELALAGWYLTGSEPVLQRNDMEAYLWARKAATAGLAKAEYAMGYFTEEGIGVPANLEDAKRWYWRAAAQDYPKARGRLEELKRLGKNAGRSGERDRISRSKIGKQNEGECSVM